MKLFAEQPVRISRIRSFRSEAFPVSGPVPWLDRDDAPEQIARAGLSDADAELCRYWARNGYVILESAVESRTLDEVWAAYEDAIRRGKIVLQPEKISDDDPFPGRFLNPHKKASEFCRVLKHPRVLRAIRLLIGHEPKPLQTIASHKGSQQSAHSDSIHMTTYPLGFLSAAWTAFEDIHPDSGPLVFYPGSHRLPYVFSKDVGITEADFKSEGYAAYQSLYEPYIHEQIAAHGLEPRFFHARKGDTLIWHANLLHGGSSRKDVRRSRRAMVAHYFARGAFVYHDLASHRSMQQYLGTCLLRTSSGERRLGKRR